MYLAWFCLGMAFTDAANRAGWLVLAASMWAVSE